jgi:YggT family protein
MLMGSLIFQTAQFLFEGYYWLMIIYIISSWFPNFRSTKLGSWIEKMVDPYLSIFRRFIPPIGGMIDLSPIVAFFAYRFIKGFALEGLRSLLSIVGLL